MFEFVPLLTLILLTAYQAAVVPRRSRQSSSISSIDTLRLLLPDGAVVSFVFEVAFCDVCFWFANRLLGALLSSVLLGSESLEVSARCRTSRVGTGSADFLRSFVG